MPIRLDSAPERTTGSPLTSVITSPDFRPAAAAALSGATLETSAPSGALQAERIGERLVQVLHRHAEAARAAALPVATIWSLTFSATSIGIANDTPWKPPLRE